MTTATADMLMPVRCAWCSRTYDLCNVEVTHRYADCSMWNAPCCGRQVDDRGETGWKTTKDYYPLSREALNRGYEYLLDGSMRRVK